MTLDFLLRLLAAFACGVAIGLERQMRQRTAGLRTITLVSSGACLFVTLGVLSGNGSAGVTQIAAYVVSGVGFSAAASSCATKARSRASIRPRRSGARPRSACSAAPGISCPRSPAPGVVLIANTGLRELSRAINTAPVDTADLVREYVFTVVCRERDEIHVRAMLSNTLTSAPLSFQSLSSRDLEDASQRVEVTATFRLHPKYQYMLEQVASRLGMEKGVSSVGWRGLEAEPTPSSCLTIRSGGISRRSRSGSPPVVGLAQSTG